MICGLIGQAYAKRPIKCEIHTVQAGSLVEFLNDFDEFVRQVVIREQAKAVVTVLSHDTKLFLDDRGFLRTGLFLPVHGASRINLQTGEDARE